MNRIKIVFTDASLRQVFAMRVGQKIQLPANAVVGPRTWPDGARSEGSSNPKAKP